MTMTTTATTATTATNQELLCAICDELISPGDEHKHNGSYYCGDCWEEYTVCDRCDDLVPRRYATLIHGIDEVWCEYCTDNYAAPCDHCGGYFRRYDLNNDYGDHYCDSCFSEYYFRCDGCGHIYSRYDINGHNGLDFCNDCYRDITREEVIHDYSFKPDPQFFGYYGSFGKYFGIELEIDRGGENPDNAEKLISIMPEELIYCKHDGSLNRGFEIVTHPMSYDYLLRHKEDFTQMLEEALLMGYRSHDAETCGLHIHVSRDYFGGEAGELKALYFFEKFWNKIIKFSRRTQEQADRWAARYCQHHDELKDTDGLYQKAKYSGRYHAINLENRNTLEFRIFRGTLNSTTFFATVQFIEYLTNYLQEITLERLQVLTWTEFVESIPAIIYPELVTYLDARGLYDSPEANEKIQETLEEAASF
jgi:formylmethanofuran dehydrogenase subunit E